MDQSKEAILRDIKRIGNLLTSKDLYEILKSAPPRSVEFAFRKYKRDKTKKRDHLETYIESVMVNYFEKEGKIASKGYIRDLIRSYKSNIPVKEKSDGTYEFPKRIEKIITRVYNRVYRRYYNRQKSLKRKEALKKLSDVAQAFFDGEHNDKGLFYKAYKEAEPYMTKKEKNAWKETLVKDVGLPDWMF